MGMALTRWRHAKPTVPAAAVALIVLLAGADVFAQKRAITHEDVWLAKRLGAPIVSPDGKWAAVQVTEPAYDERDQASDLWLVPDRWQRAASPADRHARAERAAQPGTPTAGASRSRPAARPTKPPQIYVIDVAGGGEAQRVTTLAPARARRSGGRTARRWPSSATSIRVRGPTTTTGGSRPSGASASGTRASTTASRSATGIAGSTTAGRAVRPGRSTRRRRRRTSSPARSSPPAPGFAGQWGSGSDTISATWTPDGAGLVFAATANRHEAAFTDVVQALWLVPAAGGEPRRLTSMRRSYERPTFTPDGRTLLADVPGGEREGLQPDAAGRLRLGVAGGPAGKPASSTRY